MKIISIESGFALYKEKDEIGRCALTPTPKGGTFGAFCILPQWRRKGYGSYLLKEALRALGGYDREQATVFTAPLPTDPGEAAFWAKFDFQPEGTQLVRRRTPDLTAVRFVQDFLAARLTAPRLCIDATCGNGGDTAFMCGLSAASGGRVLGFDIQPEAIWRKKALRQSFTATATQTCCNTLHPARQMPSCSTLAGSPGPTTRYSPRQAAASPRWKRPSRPCAPAGCSVRSSTAGGSSARTKSGTSCSGRAPCP